MNPFKSLLGLLNGKKLNTGTIMVITVVVLKQLFGISDAEATNLATNIMIGIGGAMALWGYIDRWRKSLKANK